MVVDEVLHERRVSVEDAHNLFLGIWSQRMICDIPPRLSQRAPPLDLELRELGGIAARVGGSDEG